MDAKAYIEDLLASLNGTGVETLKNRYKKCNNLNRDYVKESKSKVEKS